MAGTWQCGPFSYINLPHVKDPYIFSAKRFHPHNQCPVLRGGHRQGSSCQSDGALIHYAKLKLVASFTATGRAGPGQPLTVRSGLCSRLTSPAGTLTAEPTEALTAGDAP
jgi:hypothetical protein